MAVVSVMVAWGHSVPVGWTLISVTGPVRESFVLVSCLVVVAESTWMTAVLVLLVWALSLLALDH